MAGWEKSNHDFFKKILELTQTYSPNSRDFVDKSAY